jgi:hypothetical protein
MTVDTVKEEGGFTKNVRKIRNKIVENWLPH